MIKTHFILTKPGIIMGNAITTAGGFALASRGQIDWWLFLATLTGLSLIIASACVFNNYVDREADKKMERTKHRPLVTGAISVQNALSFGLLLGVSGIALLYTYTNILTLAIAIVGFFIYVVLYAMGKYQSTYGTLIGSVAGGVPPLVGYCAVTNRFDLGALLLFMILVLWQMPHFFAIAMYRYDDYAAANIPVLPVRKGMHVTKVHMLAYTIAFLACSLTLTLCGYTGYAYLVVAALLGLAWLRLCLQGFKAENDHLWARQMFRLSLVIITVLCITMSVDTI